VDVVTGITRSRGLGAKNVAGGMSAWMRSGLPMVGDEGKPRVA